MEVCVLPNPKLSQIMNTQPHTVLPDQKLSDVLRLFNDFHLRHVPVCKGNRPVGLLSDRDLKQFSLSVLFQDRPNVNAVFLDHVLRLKEVYRRAFCSLSPSATLLDALEAMETLRFFCVPIVDANYDLLGVVGVSEVLRYIAELPKCRDRHNRPLRYAKGKRWLPVTHIMTHEPTTIDVCAGLSEAVKLMKQGGFRHLPVMRNDEPRGLLTRRDILVFTYSTAFGPEAEEEWELLDDVVDLASIMTEEPLTVPPDTEICEAARLLLEDQTGALLVTSRGGRKLEGIITERDFIRFMRNELHEYWNPQLEFASKDTGATASAHR
jgi:CBS domain-containing protein